MKFVCWRCGKEYAFGETIWKCSCGGYLMLKNKVVFTKADIKKDLFNMWRYDKAYAIRFEDISISYNEGLTPLVRLNYENYNIRLKLEYLMPTGSFKDRGTVMAVNYLKNNNITNITEDSSGNSASSVAGYCALGRLDCEVFVPAGNSSGKIWQAAAYGAKINAVPGTRDDVAKAAQKHEISYAGHNWHPLFSEGTKSIAYELWEQNGFKVPKNIICPCGGGNLALGLVHGFEELLENGEIDELPRIFPVQPENCNPIYRIFHNIKEPFTAKPTIAEGTSIAFPVKGEELAEGVRKCGGKLLSVTEDEIKAALKVVCQRGFYTEPTSATAVAGALQLIRENYLTSEDEIVIIISGNGLKAGDKIKELLA
jgi:threonine synthase